MPLSPRVLPLAGLLLVLPSCLPFAAQGYTDEAAPGVEVVPSSATSPDAMSSALLTMRFEPGTPRQEVTRRFMRLASDYGASRLSDIVIQTVRPGAQGRTLCSVGLGPQADTRLVTGTRWIPSRTEYVRKRVPVTRYVTRYERRCRMVSRPVTRMETTYETSYDYISKRTRRTPRTRSVTRYEMKNECRSEPVRRMVTRYESQTERKYVPPKTVVVSRRVTEWSLDASAPHCTPTTSSLGGVIHGIAYFPEAVPPQLARRQRVPLPSHVDCSGCGAEPAPDPACAEAAGPAPPSADGAERVLELGSMEAVAAAEPALSALTGAVVRFELADGGVIEGTLGRVHAGRCTIRGDDEESAVVDLMQAARVHVPAAAVASPPPPRCRRKARTCPEACARAAVASPEGEDVAPVALTDEPAEAAPSPAPSPAPLELTTLTISNLDDVVAAEATLQRRVGSHIALLLEDGARVSGILGRVHAATVTVQVPGEASHYVNLLDVREIELRAPR